MSEPTIKVEMVCPVCTNGEAKVANHPTRDASVVDCPQCGRFTISRSAVAFEEPNLGNLGARAKTRSIAQQIDQAHEGGLHGGGSHNKPYDIRSPHQQQARHHKHRQRDAAVEHAPGAYVLEHRPQQPGAKTQG